MSPCSCQLDWDFQQVKVVLCEELCDLFLSYEETRDSLMISVPAGEDPNYFVEIFENSCQSFGKKVGFFQL